MSVSFSRLNTIIIMGVIIIGSITLWSVILTDISEIRVGEKTPRVEMLLDTGKLLAQLVLVTTIGATVSFLYTSYSKKQEQLKLKQQEDNKLRRELLESVIDVRADIEKTRREFRLIPSEKQIKGYQNTIRKILNSRLQLSKVWHATETWKELYPNKDDEIQKSLNGMKGFLDKLVTEYEIEIANIQTNDYQGTDQRINDLKIFGPFVYQDQDTEYTDEFLPDFRKAASIIRNSILGSAE